MNEIFRIYQNGDLYGFVRHDCALWEFFVSFDESTKPISFYGFMGFIEKTGCFSWVDSNGDAYKVEDILF